MNATHHTAPGGEGALVRHLNPTRLRDAAVAWVQHNGLHIRERGDKLHFDWPDREDSRRNDPPCMLLQSSGAGWDAREGQVINAKALADRAGMQLREFLDRWAGEAFAPTRTTRPAPASPPDATSLAQWEKRKHSTAAWTAAWEALGETERGARRFIEDVRGAWCPPNVGSLARVMDNKNAGPVLNLAGGKQRAWFIHHLPAIVTPLVNAETGAIGGLAYRTHDDGKNGTRGKGVISGSDTGAPYFIGRVRPGTVVVLTEGITDTLAVSGLLASGHVHDAVGVPGAGRLKAAVEYLSTTHPVVVLHDDDDTGRKAAERAAEQGGRSRPVRMVDWRDVLGALIEIGMPPDDEDMKDASDVIRKAKKTGRSMEDVRSAFVWGIGSALARGAA